MKITAVVCYPVYVEVEVADDADEDTKREALLDKSDQIIEASSIKPVITDCSDETLME